MKTLTRPDTPDKKKRITKCPAKKRKTLISTYRRTGGSIKDLAKRTGVSRSRIYEIFESYPEVREQIDSFDEEIIEEDKDEAVGKLRDNVKDGLQRAIEYTLEKEPRKERGKIVVNKDEFKGPSIELYLGVRQEVIIE